MANRIVCFGDSWTYGADLIDPALIPVLEEHGYKLEDAEWKYFHKNKPYREEHRYSNLLEKQLGIPVENISRSGDSLIGMREKFINWVDDQPGNCDSVIVIFALTSSDRYSFLHNESKIWISSSDLTYKHKKHNMADIWKLHLVHCAGRPLSLYTLKDFIYTTRAICKERNIRYLYAPAFRDEIMMDVKVDPQSVTRFTMKEIIEIEDRNGHDVWAWGEHPNELGHKFIAEYLINEMKERKILT